MNNPVKILIALAGAAALVWLTSSVRAALTPFVLAMVIAYVCAPLAQKLETRRLSPALAASILVVFVLILLFLLPLAIVPLVLSQLNELAGLLPPLVEKVQDFLGTHFGTDLSGLLAQSQDLGRDALDDVNAGQVGTAVQAAGGAVQALAGALGKGVGVGVSILSGFFTILLITPLATFYFLRDRKSISGELTELLPPHLREQTLLFMDDLNNVLDEFLHGQLIVMLTMAAFYSIVLKLAGLPFALTIGILSGILTFIPYVGFICGILLATIVGAGHFDSFFDVAIVWMLMGIGTTVESVVITPRLVGERVGLHPLAVLLSLFVMGDLFGFVGVLAALPIAAVLLVCGRHLRRRYIGSKFYGQQ